MLEQKAEVREGGLLERGGGIRQWGYARGGFGAGRGEKRKSSRGIKSRKSKRMDGIRPWSLDDDNDEVLPRDGNTQGQQYRYPLFCREAGKRKGEMEAVVR